MSTKLGEAATELERLAAEIARRNAETSLKLNKRFKLGAKFAAERL